MLDTLAGRGRPAPDSALAKLRSAMTGFASLRPFIEQFAGPTSVKASPAAAHETVAMNTDDSVIMDYRDALPPRLVDEVRRLIPEVDDEVFERFIKRIRFPVSACRTEQRAHQTIPDAKDQDRYVKKLDKKLDRLSNLAADVSTLLDEAHFGLLKAAGRASADFSTVQRVLDLLAFLLQEVLDVAADAVFLVGCKGLRT